MTYEQRVHKALQSAGELEGYNHPWDMIMYLAAAAVWALLAIAAAVESAGQDQ